MTAEATGAREALLQRMATLISELARDTWGWRDIRADEAMDILREFDVEEIVEEPNPTPSASPEADGRTWTIHPYPCGVILTYEDVRTTSCTCPEGASIPVVPRSDLARVQRERDEARKLVAIRTASRDRWKKFAMHEQLEKVQSLRAERDAALDRARVAEQRIETGESAWKNAAQMAGEELADTGPANYFALTAEQWLAWMRDKGMAVRDRLRCLTADFDDLAKQHNALKKRLADGVACNVYSDGDRQTTRGRFVADTEET